MATFRVYTCKACGYSVQTEPSGHYYLISGEYTNYKCSNCNEVVSINSFESIDDNGTHECPQCKSTGSLTKWNPVKGPCPICGERMVVDKDAGVIMAD